MSDEVWPRVAVVGAGAVGCYFGGRLARAGAPVTLIGRPHHVDVLARDGLWLDSLHFQERIPVATSTRIEAAHNASVVLFCVKTVDTEDAARLLAPHLAPGAVVVSLQNGVDNVERVQTAGGFEAIPAVVYVAAAMTGPGRVKHTGRGDLIIGSPGGGRSPQVDQIKGLFTRAQVPCVVSDNIAGDLWTKMILNCAFNAFSALSRTNYGRIVENSEAREVLKKVIAEAAAVARACGVRLPPKDLVEAAWQLAAAMTEAMSSTAQDLAREKPTEIDSLNGYIVRRGAELGVAVPANQTLYALVKLLEKAVQSS